MEVADNHFVSDFLHLIEELSSVEIAAELSFQDREFVFHELTLWINGVIKMASHFLTVGTANDLILSGADRDYRIGVKIFTD